MPTLYVLYYKLSVQIVNCTTNCQLSVQIENLGGGGGGGGGHVPPVPPVRTPMWN